MFSKVIFDNTELSLPVNVVESFVGLIGMQYHKSE